MPPGSPGAVGAAGTPAPGALAYRREVDGLRAVAVMVVVLFHARLGCPGGFLGVDVFFVISGFLITALIRRAVEARTYSLADFWLRRVRRIVPAMLVVVFAVLLAGLVVLLPQSLSEAAHSAQAQFTMLANGYFWTHADYFAAASAMRPLLHMWSLSLEEQFYLVYPLVFPVLWRWWPGGTRVLLVLALGLSLGLCLYATPRYPLAAFYLPFTRAWELLLGALLALGGVPQIRARWFRELVAWVGLAAIAVAVAMPDFTTSLAGSAALVPCLGTAAIIHATTSARTSVGMLLSLRVFVGIGLISYSLYLWHWPVLVFAGYGWPMACESPAVLLGLIALSMLVAWGSYVWIEMPFRRRRLLARPEQLLLVVLGGMWVGIALASVIIWRSGLPARFGQLPGDDPFPRASHAVDVDHDRLVPFGSGEADARPGMILLWGDSHAGALAPGLDLAAARAQRSGVHVWGGRAIPLEGAWYGGMGPERRELIDSVLRWIERHQPHDVVLAARWAAYIYGDTQAVPDAKWLLTDAAVEGRPTMASACEALRRGLRRTVERLLAAGVERIWIVKQVPCQPSGVGQSWLVAKHLGLEPVEHGISLQQHQRRQKLASKAIDAVAAAFDRVRSLDPTPWLSDSTGFTLLLQDGKPLYRDGSHLSSWGARRVAPMFQPLFDSSANGN